MALTIEEALQQGIAAHKEGKLQDAERLYQAILQAQPLHQDANHNLGVLAVSVNKIEAALPLFKTALESNPKTEQFWLSYIDALIKGKDFDNARQVLEQAKKHGVAIGKLNIFETLLTPTAQGNESKLASQKKSLKISEKHKKSAKNKKAKEKNHSSQGISPPQAQIDNLLKHYQSGRISDAEKLAVSITQEFPKHQLGWNVLGAILGQTRREAESVNAIQKATALSPQDAEAHYNLGVTLQKLGRLDEAEACYTQAIALRPDFTTAHYNLGDALKRLGRLDEAAASYTQAIALKPDFAEAHNNLGNMLKELGRLDEAAASYRQAIALKPDHAEAYSNLGVTLKGLGRLDEAAASYTQAIALKPDFAEAYYNLGNTLNELGRLDKAEASYRQTISFKPNYTEAHYNLGNTLKELGRLDKAEASYRQAISLKPDYAEAHNDLGNTLKELGRLDDAKESYRQAIALKPGYTEAHYNLGLIFSEAKEYEKAVEQFKSSNHKLSKSYLLRCFYQLNVQSRFFNELDYLINQGEVNSIIGSLGCRSALKYGLERPNLFCKYPLKYVLHTDLNAQYDFEKVFVEKARTILNKNNISGKRQPLLINGYQTSGNLFDIKSDFTENIQKVIRLEVEKYRINFKNSEEGLIKNWPTDYSIYGWLISMKSGGELRPHMHERGWISGSIYINVPSKSRADSGNLVVCIDDEESVTERHKNPTKSINVVTGNLVLFPASLMHYTVPFKSEEERIVLAFDVISKW